VNAAGPCPASEEARAERAQEGRLRRAWLIERRAVVHDDRFGASRHPIRPAPRGCDVISSRGSATTDPQANRVECAAGAARDGFLGRDGRTTLTTFELGIDDGTAKRVLPEVERGLSRFDASGLRVYVVGQSAAFAARPASGAAALTRVELILFPLVVVM